MLISLRNSWLKERSILTFSLNNNSSFPHIQTPQLILNRTFLPNLPMPKDVSLFSRFHFNCKPSLYCPVLSLFTIVSFKNDPCQSLTGNNGTCLSHKDCDKRGGITSGTCASGFGACCISRVIDKENSNDIFISLISFQDVRRSYQYKRNIFSK